ncbi:MAG TPA: hypothetical protein PLY70_05905 [Saprospiraceae bacterium]|nr:hypothetical protein [Saprospiraceae bacterium]HPN68935.1 hypothetical protein [Saprospiraceae bacterium]
MKEKLVYLFIFLGFASCIQKEKGSRSEKAFNNNDPLNVITEQIIKNDPLLATLENDLNEMVKNPKFSVEKEFVNNRHVDNVIDTISTFKFNETTIQSYKTSTGAEWIIEAQIQNTDFKLAHEITVGMDKKSLENILKTKLNSDLIKISNEEETSAFVFKFQKDILTVILYEGYVD